MPSARRLGLACSTLAAALTFIACGDDAAEDDDADPNRVAVTLRVAVPRRTPDDARVFLQRAPDGAGAADPADPELELAPIHPKVYAITLDLARGETITFNFTRGAAELVETGPLKAPVEPRTLVADQTKTLELVIDTWPDSPPGFRTRYGNIRTLEVPGFLDGRRVWVYLPPDYNDDRGARYPVLYMLDGQNLFDASTAFIRVEWKIDDALEELIPAGEVEPIIVVGVDNGGTQRIAEYTPWVDQRIGGGDGDAHLRTIIEVLMPYIDAEYRTLRGPEHTGFVGSSLGGLMALYAAYHAADSFGVIGAVSPSIWVADRALLDDIEGRPKPSVRIWADMGTEEGPTAIPNLRLLRDALIAQGFVEGEDLRVVEVRGGEHDEAAWSARVPDILRFLFPPRS